MCAVESLSGPTLPNLNVIIWANFIFAKSVSRKTLRNMGFWQVFVRQVLLTIPCRKVIMWATFDNLTLHKFGPDNDHWVGPDDDI